jgi:hypothetical protein
VTAVWAEVGFLRGAAEAVGGNAAGPAQVSVVLRFVMGFVTCGSKHGVTAMWAVTGLLKQRNATVQGLQESG